MHYNLHFSGQANKIGQNYLTVYSIYGSSSAYPTLSHIFLYLPCISHACPFSEPFCVPIQWNPKLAEV